MCWPLAVLLRRICPDWRATPARGSAPTWSLAGLALVVLGCLFIAGCAPRDSSAEDNRPGGFYGGVSGGMTRH